MMRPYPLRRLIPFALVVLLLPACSDSGDEAGDTTLAPTTTETTTGTTAATTTAPTTTTTAATTTTATTTTQPTATPLEGPRILENGDFETGDLTGWTMETFRDGEWLVYEDGLTPPDPKYLVPGHTAFELPDPPQGRYAAVTDTAWAGAGVRYLYRDIEVTEPYVLHALVFYQNSWTVIRDPGHFKLTDETQTQWYQNQQYRVEVIDPTAPIDTVEPDHIWGTLFHTKPGDPTDLKPTRVSLDLSPWQGETVRLRLVCVSHIYGPMRAGVDDVDVRVSN